MKIEQKINKDLILREKLALQRTIMSNQTTFLAFLRTSMYFLVAGLSIRNLLKIENSFLIEISLFFFSFVVFVIGVYNYFKQDRLIKENEKHIGDYKLEYLQEK